MDLRLLLPRGEVSPGDTWSVPARELRDLLAPGGDLVLRPDEVDVEQMERMQELLGGFGEGLMEDLQGSCVCTFKGVREVDGESLAEIALEIAVTFDSDVSDLLNEVLDAIVSELGDDAPEITVDSADLVVDLEGEGLLTWNLGAGRFQSLGLSGEVEMNFDLEVGGDIEGESLDAAISAELSGTFEETADTGG
jgi:hypothetical protein